MSRIVRNGLTDMAVGIGWHCLAACLLCLDAFLIACVDLVHRGVMFCSALTAVAAGWWMTAPHPHREECQAAASCIHYAVRSRAPEDYGCV